MDKQVLIVAAHPDDDVLGCGGTMAKLSAAGAKVNVGFLSDGVSSRSDGVADRAALDRRQDAAREACRILGAEPPEFGTFADNGMDGVPLIDIVRKIESLIARHRPSLLITHCSTDVNVDHRRIHDAIAAACRPQLGQIVRTVLFFEVPSSTEWQFPGTLPAFAPNWFEDISATFDLKMQALAVYGEELRDWPHPRSVKGVEALARWRGATIGAEAAEGFVLGRRLA